VHQRLILELLVYERNSVREIHLIVGMPTGLQIPIFRFDSDDSAGAHERVMSTRSGRPPAANLGCSTRGLLVIVRGEAI